MQCGAKTRSGKPCKAAAMKNGRCRMHGGKALGGADSPTFKHGLYSRYVPSTIQDKITTYEKADPLDLTHELVLSRALLAEFLTKLTIDSLDKEFITTVSDLVGNIGKIVERISKIKNASALTAAEITYLAARCAEIVSRYINDPTQQQAFVSELFAGVREAPPGVAEQVSTDGD